MKKRSMFQFGQSVTLDSATEPPQSVISSEYEEYLKKYEGRLGLFCLGGQGSHIASEAYALKYRFTEIVVLNTDYKDNSKIRENCPGVRVFDIGKNSYEISGAGAGGRPDVAERGFSEVDEEVLKMLKEFKANDMQAAFIAVGLGGGTGTGLIAPFLKLCREAGIYRSIVLATMPSLTMHGIETVRLAEEKLEEIQTLCDGVMIINNEWIYAAATQERISLPVIYDRINRRLANALGSFIEVMLSRSRQNIDLNDLLNFIAPDENNVARLFVLGKGIGHGENRVLDSVKNALDSFYLVGHGDILGAKALLYHTLTVRGSGDAYPEDMRQLVDYIEECTDTILSIKKLGGGEADYQCDDPEFTDDAMLQVLLVTGFDKTPIEAFRADLELELAAEKERYEEKKRAREARANKAADSQSTPSSDTTKTESNAEFVMPEFGTKKPEHQNVIEMPVNTQKEQPVQVAAERLRPQPTVPKRNIFPMGYIEQYDAEMRQLAIEKSMREKKEVEVQATTVTNTVSTEKNDISSEANDPYTDMLNR